MAYNRYILAIVFDNLLSRVLLIKKERGLYTGVYNGLGGKIEGEEHPCYTVYRKLYEEARITPDDIRSSWFLTLETNPEDWELYVFAVRLKDTKDIEEYRGVITKKRQLSVWNVEELYDVRDNRLAGNGNLPYFIQAGKRVLEGSE